MELVLRPYSYTNRSSRRGGRKKKRKRHKREIKERVSCVQRRFLLRMRFSAKIVCMGIDALPAHAFSLSVEGHRRVYARLLRSRGRAEALQFR